MYVHPEFPEHRRRDPRYRAELRVYEAIRASDAHGIALYGARQGAPVPRDRLSDPDHRHGTVRPRAHKGCQSESRHS